MRGRSIVGLLLGLLSLGTNAWAQGADDICREFGETPTREVGRDNRLVPYVFGRILLRGLPDGAKQPRVTAMYSDNSQPAARQVVGRSGNYCFQKRGTSGTIIIEIDGVEVARKSVSDISTQRQREDFEVFPPGVRQNAPPAVISAKFNRPPNEKTIDLYKRLEEADRNKRPDEATEILKQIVELDADDFLAFARLGSTYIERNMLLEAEAAFKKALSIRRDYTPAMISLGMMKGFQGDFAEAIRYLERAVASDPSSARAFRILGEAYLQVKRGSDGLAALDEAIRLDPIGMAECHLLKARLYDLAGARNMAANEYREFIAKVPEHPEKKKFERYIKENSGR